MTGQADNLFREAFDHHQAGRLEEASRLYRAVLERTPDHVDSVYLLGVIAHQTGTPTQAIELMHRALAIVPDQARCYNLQGLDLLALGRAEDAEASFRRAIALDDSPDGCNNLGVLCKDQGRLDDAIAAYRQALARAPEDAAAHYNLGNVYRGQGDLGAAEECFRRAIAIDGDDGSAWAALGQTLQALAKSEAAVVCLEKALTLSPEDADLYCDLGDCLQTLGRLAAANAAYQKALDRNPGLARAWYSAGCATSSQHHFASASVCFRKALEIHPDWLEARHNLGRVLFKLGQVDEALEVFRQTAAGENPGLAQAAIAVIIPGSPSSDNQAIYDARRTWAECQLPRAAPPERASAIREGGVWPLRIGYVSAFFQDDNWMKPVWGLINHHDRHNYEIHLYSDAPAGKIQHGYRAESQDHFHDTSKLTNEALCRHIQESGIDLLVDLNGYSAMHRLPLFAMRPAPLVAGWFNLFATTGIPGYDYLIGDDVVIPPEEEKFYCEKIVRVPGSYLTFEVAYPVPAVADSPHLTSGMITYGSLAPQYKITNEVIEVWSRILQQVPESSLLLKNRALVSSGTRRFVHGLFESQGVSPGRVRLDGPSNHYQFLETYAQIDIALDTFPYNGGTTTTEAIWQGVPVVAFRGDRWVSRTSASILQAANLGDWCGQGVEDYVALAVRMGRSPDPLRELRRNMRARLARSRVCDTAGFARNMESLYERMCSARRVS